MTLILKSDKKTFNEAWEASFPNVTQGEMFEILSNNILVNSEEINFLNVEINKNGEFDFYHEKVGDMHYTFFMSIAPLQNKIIQKHFYPNTPKPGKYAQFLYNTKITCDMCDISEITFYVPNKKISKFLGDIGAKPSDLNHSLWKVNFSDADRMEMYFDLKRVRRINKYDNSKVYL